MSQGIYALVGWILGPIGGAIASGIGALIGVFLAPHTTSVWPVSVLGGVIASFTAGSMVLGEKRKGWWVWETVLFVIFFLLFVGRAIIQDGVGVYAALAGSFVDWSAILLFALPVLVLGIPLFDTALVFISRFRRGVSLLQGGVDHTSHRLSRIGLEPLGATLALDLAGSGLGMIAIFVMQANVLEGYLVGMLTFFVACYVLWKLEGQLGDELRVGQNR